MKLIIVFSKVLCFLNFFILLRTFDASFLSKFVFSPNFLNQGSCIESKAEILFLTSFVNIFFIRLLASSEISDQSSSGNSNLPLNTARYISSSVSPLKGG